MPKLNGILLGDAMIPHQGFRAAWDKYLAPYGQVSFAGDWEPSWDKLQYRRLEVEKQGPEIEDADPLVLSHGKDCNVLAGLFVPVSSKVIDAMPSLRIVGVSRAGLENVNVPAATGRGVLVFNVQGRNAHAVSDFAVGMMLAECRNIARAHYAIKNGQWRKTFANSDTVPELGGRTVGLVGFGFIGSLVAKKLSGFEVKVVVYDPYAAPDRVRAAGAVPVGIEELFKMSDFISIHARLTDENKKMIGRDLLSLMKPTAYFINTGRAGLVDQDALVWALKNKKIQGAALDVFTTEPLPADSPYLGLDNVTLTTHLAGTTSDALTNSPYLLLEDIARFLKGEDARFIINREVLDNPGFRQWLSE
ncbi:MAG: 2-hydroxyacid dehydrogenase [Spirochaetaceae bacterium]|jgi:D-3-phosphoglycerate dehydrogenase|nr:2-hydroxyacid dehydrogenase [Spirochaetaceae bacterium]